MNIGSIIFSVLAIGALMLLFVVIYNYLPISEKEEYDRVVFIPGIKTPPSVLVLWKHYLAHHYPDAEREFVEGNYNYDEIQKVVEIQEKSVEALKKPGKTLVVVHSYGAVQIVAAIQNNLEVRENVKLIIAMAPAFDPAVKVLDLSKNAIGYKYESVEAPMKVICGSLDTTVPCASTGFPGVTDRGWVISFHPTFLVPQIFGGRNILKH